MTRKNASIVEFSAVTSRALNSIFVDGDDPDAASTTSTVRGKYGGIVAITRIISTKKALFVSPSSSILIKLMMGFDYINTLSEKKFLVTSFNFKVYEKKKLIMDSLRAQ